MKLSNSSLKVLYIDLECKPGHWIGGDYVSKIITAGAWSYNTGEVEVMTHFETSPYEIALTMAAEIQDCDMVVGHYIRGFDLPLLNGELLKSLLPPLDPCLSLDTKLDLIKNHGRSQSQENLAAQVGLTEQKVKVTLPEWEGFNSLDGAYREKGIARVRDDVIQNRALRAELNALGWLGEPKMWSPHGTGKAYRA